MRRVVIVVYDGFQLLDMTGPADVFGAAGLLCGEDGYRVEPAAVRAGSVRAHGGITVTAAHALADVRGPLDTLLVTGGWGTPAHLDDRELVGQIARLAGLARRVASVCTGAFLLAEAGLLDGRRATAHWGWLDRLADFGATPVSERVVTDGKIVTAAGASAGIDMALSLLAEARDVPTAQAAQLAIEYDPRPPFDAGSPATASAGLAERALSLIA
ncbi:DJ-1/PfpI family protein [Thermostaphylospora chromogena]|uniref:DJ-1/PfpI family protein n=1 Tax=Thermostaphylospora chromogena TaxID=35622 RepID=A0A1H1GIA3_9ACTN|nr:DJ-1/PfpI family protein [Thermostaphylospora chromogena]SDR12616.1 DJ-1/PfpI family protein [Thermostaphylospora chromogena]